jgi:adenosylmethionine-8-amino-7-oxononanoate aminotransferase
MHFTRQGPLSAGAEVPIIVKGSGHHIWDDKGKKYFDGLSGLFVVNAGHGRKRLAEVAAKQAEELAFFPLWSYAHPAAIELADKLADSRLALVNHELPALRDEPWQYRLRDALEAAGRG